MTVIEDEEQKSCDCSVCKTFPANCEGCEATFTTVTPSPEQEDQRTHKEANRVRHASFVGVRHLCDTCYFALLEAGFWD